MLRPATLKGDLIGFHSIRINQQRRITFRGTEQGPAEAAITDYYRLSIYWRSFTEPDDHERFKEGTPFEPIWELYNFDRELRKLVNEACKRLEISLIKMKTRAARFTIRSWFSVT